MTKRTVRARQAALPETRRELDDPVVVIGEKIAAAIAAIDHKDQQPACATTERDGLALSDYLAAFEIAIYSVIDVLYRETAAILKLSAAITTPA
jgi:hypothetical protein